MIDWKEFFSAFDPMQFYKIHSSALARRSDHLTSKEAALNVNRFRANHHQKILAALALSPMGKSGIAKVSGLTEVQVARRMPELQRMGLIELTGNTVKSASGYKEREWRLSKLNNK